MSTSQTPAGHVIQPRDIAFGRNQTKPRWWLNGDPVATAFYNTMSVTFPPGERFFIDSVRHYKDIPSPELQKQIAAFTSQEFIHAREHVVFNRQAVDAGYDQAKFEAFMKRRIEVIKKFPAISQLAVTIALEHFTAILAHAGIADPRHMQGAPDENARLWRWHAMEEIEHKAVAFDTYLAATKNWNPLRRYALRCGIMFISTIMFLGTIGIGCRDSFKQDGINRPRTWFRLIGYLFGKNGIMRQVLGAYFSYYRPGFHPWNHDDRDLIAVVQKEMGLADQYAAA
ncbi:MAG TPA: metal-dependent hydrolase [Rhizomicrobium sp.]|nr:metal-dependent hydrolase [Rhizomicrobium sp.]